MNKFMNSIKIKLKICLNMKKLLINSKQIYCKNKLKKNNQMINLKNQDKNGKLCKVKLINLKDK